MHTFSGKRLRIFKGWMGVVLCTIPAAVWAAEGTGDYIHYRLGVKYKNEKNNDRAIEEFRKVLAAYPDNYNAYFHMAEIRSEQQRPRLVIYNLKKALSYNPGWGKAQKMLAVAFEKDGQFEKAVIELQQFQQNCDPAERDSIQLQIDRIINRVSGKTTSDTADEKKGAEPTHLAAEAGSVAAPPEKPKAPAAEGKRSSVPSARSERTDADVQFQQALELYNQEKFGDALGLLRQVLAVSPGHAGAYYYAGLIRYRDKQYGPAVINLEKGISYPETGINAYYYLGKIYGEERKYAKAITCLFNYVEKSTYEPGRQEAKQLIETYRKLGGAAVLDAIAPGRPVDTLKGDTASPREQYFTLEVRIDSLLSMMTVDTLSDAGQLLLGGIRAFTAGKYDQAVLEFKKVLATHPSGTVAVHCLYNTGICYLKLRLFGDAENQFQLVLDRYSSHPLAANCLFLKAVSFLERSEPETAEKLLRKFIQDYRTHRWAGNAWEKLGDAYVAMEQHRKAADAYAQAASVVKRTSDKVAVCFKLGKSFLDLGNGNRAIESFERAIETGEKTNVFLRVPDSYYRIADEYYRVKEYVKALDYYTRVTRKYPSFQETPWGLFQIGSINKNLKKYQDAIDAFKELTGKFPDDYWARQAQWKMEDAVWENEYKAVLR